MQVTMFSQVHHRLKCSKAWSTLIVAMAALIMTVFAQPARTFEIEFSGRTVKRQILALYDSRQEGASHLTRIHKLAEMPLNHLGYVVVYHDVNDPLPTGEALKPYRAVLSWFVEPIAQPAAYVAWLDDATAGGLKYVMVGEIAPREADEMMPVINRILARIGLQHGGNFVDLTYRAKVTTLDPDMVGFEQKIDKVIPGFPVVALRSQLARAHLTIEAPTAAGVQRSVVIATSEGGGFAAQNFTVTLDPNTDRLGWLLNPFQFFKLALGDERFPIPDVTTMSGRRIYFSQIDGDGWNNITEVERYREQQMLSSEVILKEAIAPYPDLPVSVGLIAGDAQPFFGGTPGAAKIARQLFALPQVEVASHTHTHPYNWSFFESYNRAKEEQMVANYRPPAQPIRERVSELLLKAAGKPYTNSRYDPYIAGTDDLPRTYLRKPFDLELEVRGALKFSEGLAPAGKKAKLYLWSGDTTPFEGAVRATRQAGARNINGGDSRLDREYPSVAYVPSISRPVGRERQIYAVNSNENTYTNEWTGPYAGQMMLEHTLRNTDTPRRLKGFNLYYHMYSGEKQAALAAIKRFLDMARSTDVIPIAASDYAAVADDYFVTEIEQVELFAWAVKSRGTMQTVRFDDAEQLAVDLERSTGVLGSNRHEGSLYVTLDSAIERAVVALRARAAEASSQVSVGQAPVGQVPIGQVPIGQVPIGQVPIGQVPVTQPAPGTQVPLVSLVHSRWHLSNMQMAECRTSFAASGFGAGDLLMRTVPRRAVKFSVVRSGAVLSEDIRWADTEGLIKLSVAPDGLGPVELRFTCHE
jgi:polysaccharide biosynthesis protein PelA